MSRANKVHMPCVRTGWGLSDCGEASVAETEPRERVMMQTVRLPQTPPHQARPSLPQGWQGGLHSYAITETTDEINYLIPLLSSHA